MRLRRTQIENKYISQRDSNEHGVRYSKAVASSPAAASACHSPRQRAIFALIFLFPSILLIHDMKASSFSGTKDDDSNERTVSKFAEVDVI